MGGGGGGVAVFQPVWRARDAHLKQEISVKKWLEAKMLAVSRIAGIKYQYRRQGQGPVEHQGPFHRPAVQQRRFRAFFLPRAADAGPRGAGPAMGKMLRVRHRRAGLEKEKRRWMRRYGVR